jgi:hypothetical protein
VPTGLYLAAALQNGASARKGPVQLLFPIEVQIRTEAMDRLAENGIAVESWSCADAQGRLGRSAAAAAAGAADSSSNGSSNGSNGLAAAANGANGSSGSGSSSWDDDGEDEDDDLLALLSTGNGSSSGYNGSGSANGSNGSSNGNGGGGAGFPFDLGMLQGSAEASNFNGSSSSNGSSFANGSGAMLCGSNVLGGGSEEGALVEGSIDPQVLSRRINWLKSIREWQSEFVGTLTGARPRWARRVRGRISGACVHCRARPAGLPCAAALRRCCSCSSPALSLHLPAHLPHPPGPAASEFVECITDDLLGQSVFVFTPSGEVVRLPKVRSVGGWVALFLSQLLAGCRRYRCDNFFCKFQGLQDATQTAYSLLTGWLIHRQPDPPGCCSLQGATVVDFAYHIHTEMGNTMVAAKVNGKLVGADHELANAEVVEVVRYRGPINATIIKRHQQWLDWAQVGG